MAQGHRVVERMMALEPLNDPMLVLERLTTKRRRTLREMVEQECPDLDRRPRDHVRRLLQFEWRYPESLRHRPVCAGCGLVRGVGWIAGNQGPYPEGQILQLDPAPVDRGIFQEYTFNDVLADLYGSVDSDDEHGDLIDEKVKLWFCTDECQEHFGGEEADYGIGPEERLRRMVSVRERKMP